ncbi:MAG: SUKH-4 family immunity protein [Gemmataceae bacterium]
MDIDAEESRRTLFAGLPLEARWWVGGNSLDYNFSATRRPLQSLPWEILEDTQADWSDLLVFGERDYAEGGGACPWLCLSRTDGAVYLFDPESDSPKTLLNSSPQRFVDSFRLLESAVGENGRYPTDLVDRLNKADEKAFPHSDWKDLVDFLESNPRNREVPAREKKYQRLRKKQAEHNEP